MAVYKLNQKQHREAGLTWGTIPTETLENSTLSPMAHRLLMWMLAKPANWGFNVGHISSTFKVNRTTVTRWIKELRDAQYLSYAKVRISEAGYWAWTYTVYPLPLPRLVEFLHQKEETLPEKEKNIIPFAKEA